MLRGRIPGRSLSFSLRRRIAAFVADCRGVAATEFAFIVPLMLVMFFGTVEFCSGIAVDRKVTLMARTLSDLTSQSTSVSSSDFSNFFAASTGIMYPYSTTPVNATISELYVDPSTMKATVKWSSGSAQRTTGTQVGIPADLLVSGTYLIFSEVSYQYVPTVGYVMGKTGINLSDVAYTRPRQSTCVYLSPATSC
ncbi:pilus assembly protein [Bradyrhizobium ontarionense]|uniref:Pilus assembly protein n=1 Tax=Bradyrhizobium ontarionense TaxID=2898149 RepID=A0ABY3R2U9_9BRAD|nr:TadE/TadG family type IV pilus assembly protein [Bradyrhizobium sp. A19]UFZ01543.1 pilus assembly protein [Bradyrhizobium sp. A19]